MAHQVVSPLWMRMWSADSVVVPRAAVVVMELRALAIQLVTADPWQVDRDMRLRVRELLRHWVQVQRQPRIRKSCIGFVLCCSFLLPLCRLARAALR